jgi:hypothetical protein
MSDPDRDKRCICNHRKFEHLTFKDAYGCVLCYCVTFKPRKRAAP